MDYFPIIDKSTKIYKRTDFAFEPETEIQVPQNIENGIFTSPGESPKWNGTIWMQILSAESLALIEEANQKAIKIKADEIIEEMYNPLKQRKLMSIAIALQDKLIHGGTLTTDEETLMQSCRDSNTWITAVRTVENNAIANKTKLADIVWPQ